MTASLSPERRAELLAVALPDQLIALAERCASAEDLTVVPPEVGTIILEVRDPIAYDRFHLGEVLACRAEVLVEGGHGWAVRLGDDRLATLAAAICDAEADANRPLAAEVDELCRVTEARLRIERSAESAELAATQVTFEELD